MPWETYSRTLMDKPLSLLVNHEMNSLDDWYLNWLLAGEKISHELQEDNEWW